MLPERLLRVDIRDDVVVARYVGEDDEPWLEALIDLARRHPLLSRREFFKIASEELPPDAPHDAIELAARVALEARRDPRITLDSGREPRPTPSARSARMSGMARRAPAATTPRDPRAGSGLSPRRARWEAFLERGRSSAPRGVVLASVASRLATSAQRIDRMLFADLPSQRPVGADAGKLNAGDLRRRVNLALAQALVARASRLTIDLEGNARRVVQHATWQGLLCEVLGDDPARCQLRVSGPMAVLRATRLYARALASLVPVLPGCRSFSLRADCHLLGRELTFELDERAPIGRGEPLARHDSNLEATFESDIRRLAPDWDILREPRPLRAAGTMIFPDFALGPRDDPGARVLVEIVGWWTRDYVEKKLARLRATGHSRLITCLDTRSGRGAGTLEGLDVLPFRKRVDASRVIARARELMAR